ncbi:MAG TPA: aldehyde dehydrogenase family protein [Actinomycetes bacterium]|nr:aldehyde dehydrogenase family protein [Actinomycetes bacterium]
MQGPDRYDLFIGGIFTPSASGEAVDTIDPSTDETIATVASAGPDDVDRAVEAARTAAEGTWGTLEPKRRGALLYALSAALEEAAEEFAELETRNTGKPLQRSRREVASTVRYFRYYAGAADKIHGETIPLGPDYLDFTLREPLGVTAHIVPWNAPLNMVGRSVAPALAAGNTAVVKPATQTPLSALRLARLFSAVGFPPGTYNVVPGPGAQAGAHLVHHPGVDAITFTGSVETGRAVMRAAADHIKPLVLELGGKSPSLILGDADLGLATREVIKGIYANTGQFCNASSRVIVDARVKDSVIEQLVKLSEQLRVGPGIDNPDMGPLISAAQLDRVLDYIEAGIEQGARCLTGGSRLRGLGRGHFVAPTVFDQVDPESRIAQEEIFGPVLAVLTVDDDDQALHVANGVSYGLAAGIFTNDLNRALRLAKSLKAGQIYVNEYFAGGEETPFGGYKQSGYGREKGLTALEHYTQIKNVAVRLH